MEEVRSEYLKLRKAGARRREAGSRKFSAENYAWLPYRQITNTESLIRYLIFKFHYGVNCSACPVPRNCNFFGTGVRNGKTLLHSSQNRSFGRARVWFPIAVPRTQSAVVLGSSHQDIKFDIFNHFQKTKETGSVHAEQSLCTSGGPFFPYTTLFL